MHPPISSNPNLSLFSFPPILLFLIHTLPFIRGLFTSRQSFLNVAKTWHLPPFVIPSLIPYLQHWSPYSPSRIQALSPSTPNEARSRNEEKKKSENPLLGPLPSGSKRGTFFFFLFLRSAWTIISLLFPLSFSVV